MKVAIAEAVDPVKSEIHDLTQRVEELEKNWEELYGGQYDDDFSVDKFASKM